MFDSDGAQVPGLPRKKPFFFCDCRFCRKAKDISLWYLQYKFPACSDAGQKDRLNKDRVSSFSRYFFIYLLIYFQEEALHSCSIRTISSAQASAVPASKRETYTSYSPWGKISSGGI